MNKGNKNLNKAEPNVKDVMRLIGAGSILAASLLMPGIPILTKPFIEQKRKEEAHEWKKFNDARLKQIIKRLHAQKVVEVVETVEGATVTFTEKGRRRLLKYNLDDLILVKKKWDHKWRIIVYDVDESKRSFRRAFQLILKKLKFLQLQKSVYLTPYPCENEIEFLRLIHNIGPEVVILTVSGLENEFAYKEYFGLT